MYHYSYLFKGFITMTKIHYLCERYNCKIQCIRDYQELGGMGNGDNWGLMVNSSAMANKNVLEIDSSDACITLWM